MRGRKPKPTVLMDLHGSQEPRSLAEPVPVGDISDDPAECPRHFTADERDMWEYAVRHSPPNMLKRIDASILENWVVSVCVHREATEQFSLNGRKLTVDTPSGYPMQNPLLQIINKQALVTSRLADQLGFSPVSRPRVMAGGPQQAGEALTTRRPQPRGRKDQAEQSIEAYLASAPGSATSLN